MTTKSTVTRISFSKEELKKRADELGISVSDLTDHGLHFMFDVSPFFFQYIKDSAAQLKMSPFIFLEKLLFEYIGRRSAREKVYGGSDFLFSFSVPRQGKELLDAVYDYYLKMERRKYKDQIIVQGMKFGPDKLNPVDRKIYDIAIKEMNGYRVAQKDVEYRRRYEEAINAGKVEEAEKVADEWLKTIEEPQQ